MRISLINKEYYCMGCLKYSSPYIIEGMENGMIRWDDLLYAQFKVYFMEQLEKRLIRG